MKLWCSKAAGACSAHLLILLWAVSEQDAFLHVAIQHLLYSRHVTFYDVLHLIWNLERKGMGGMVNTRWLNYFSTIKITATVLCWNTPVLEMAKTNSKMYKSYFIFRITTWKLQLKMTLTPWLSLSLPLSVLNVCVWPWTALFESCLECSSTSFEGSYS